jgi:hypothetical protein
MGMRGMNVRGILRALAIGARRRCRSRGRLRPSRRPAADARDGQTDADPPGALRTVLALALALASNAH